MKKLILPFAIASALFFAACNTKTEEPKRDMIMLNDAQHQSSLNTDTAVNVAIEPEVQAPPTPVATPAPRQYREPVVHRSTKPKTTPVVNNQPAQPPVVVSTPAPAPAPTQVPTETTAGTSTSGDATGTTDEKATAKKGGLSKAAQGAIIGGVGGAVGGAVIGKSGKGAVIGGIIGAAGGYILGKKKDKKDTSTGNK